MTLSNRLAVWVAVWITGCPVFAANIGFYRGTFDPTHIGHFNLVKSAQQTFSLEKVFVFVNPAPSHKPNASPYVHRCLMAMLTFSRLRNVEIWDDPDGRLADNKIFTIYVEDYAARHPNDTIYLLGGDDTYQALFAPGGFGVPRGDNIRLAVSFRSEVRLFVNQDPDRTVVFTTRQNTSSTSIRSAVSEGARQPLLIIPDVLLYIERRRLYGFDENAD